MSYRTEFEGKFVCEPPLTAAQCAELKQFANERHDGDDFPSIWCFWVPTDDGSGIQATDEEMSAYEYKEWLNYLINNYLQPWGVHIEGAVRYQGEEAEDRGVLYAKGNEVRDVPDVIAPGPAPW